MKHVFRVLALALVAIAVVACLPHPAFAHAVPTLTQLHQNPHFMILGAGAIEVTTSQWDQLLQENYVLKDIVDAINKATIFKDKLKRKRTSAGRRDIYPVMVGVHQGVGARAENAKLPAAGAGQYQDAIVTTKYNYAQLYITGQAKEFSTRKAFVDFAVRLLRDTKEGMTLDIARQSWGFGTGTIALVNNGGGYGAGVSTVAVNSAYGVLWGSIASNTTFLFKQNMMVDFGTEDNNGNGYQISATTGTTITFTPPLVNAIANAVAIYRHGAANNEVEGWLLMTASASFMTGALGLSSTIYHNIDRAVYPDFEGNVTDFAAPLSLFNVRNLKDKLFRRGGNSDLCIASPNIVRDYEALLTPAQRFIPAVKLYGGATAIEHDGLKWTKDKDAPVGAMNLVKTEDIIWAERNQPNWKKQGDSIFRVVSGYDAEEATLLWYSNLDCPQPRSMALGYDITTT